MTQLLLAGWATGVAMLYMTVTLWPMVAAWREAACKA
jgi:hypothetical protein